jgi:hypothetical protein
MDYAAKASAADRMIRAYGAAATVTTVATAYNPATGSTAETPTTQDVQAVVFDYPADMIDGSLILTTDKRAYVSAVGVTQPKQGDTFNWGGVAHKIISIKPLAPALINVLFDVQNRA